MATVGPLEEESSPLLRRGVPYALLPPLPFRDKVVVVAEERIEEGREVGCREVLWEGEVGTDGSRIHRHPRRARQAGWSVVSLS